ncbi:PREDICTED: probable G-protein coupled receptor 144, partial [Phaethon lepturus]|uniref:probable G-protein coupled receptor 144 n=1 Tax=Phaethon lepturus TaxID=97097 RepID=UPI000530B20F
YLGTAVGTAVISSALLSDYQEISTSVRYRLQHHVQDLPDKLVGPICAFWNFSLSPDAGGMWSTTGCSVVTSLPDSTACFCNHTTNFAVLLQVYEMQRNTKEELTLQTLTFIGCGVSFCALIATFILFLAVGVPKSERTTVHKNLIFALAAAEALLMFSELAKTNQVVCFTVTACLHLFFMAAFSWMLVEGLLLWSKVVAVNMSEDRRMKFYYVTGWGLPVVIVGVTLATSFNKYVADNHCWLNVQTNVIWAFVGPVLFILAVNTFVLLRVVMVTVSSARRRSKMLTPNSSLEKQIGIQIWATAKPVLVLLPVLGLTWVCGVLVHLSIVWAYVFIVLNSLQ